MVFWKIQFFPKCSSSEIVDALSNYLLWKSSSSVDIFILNNYFTKKVALLKSNCPKELPILRLLLLGKIFALKREPCWKNNCCEKLTVLKKKLIKKDCCVEVSTLKKFEEVSSPKMKLSWKSRNICEKGNHHLKNGLS